MLCFGRVLALAIVLAGAAGCGSRTTLGVEGPGGTSGPSGDAGGLQGPTCGSWVATHAPVQVSATPSIMQLMTAIAAPGGVLAGYGDVQVPPVDASWKARFVSYGDGSLGPEQTPLRRASSSPGGWTSLGLALGAAGGVATASDESDGMRLVSIDAHGAPAGPPVPVPGDPGRYLLPTSTGYSALRSPFQQGGGLSTPVALATLDAAGHVIASRTLLDGTRVVSWYSRVALADGSFLLVWFEDAPCGICGSVTAQHFSESGDPLAAPAILVGQHAGTHGAYAIAGGHDGAIFVTPRWSGQTVNLTAQPLGFDGDRRGAMAVFATFASAAPLSIAVAPAAGGDYLVAWISGEQSGSRQLTVQSVAADGTAEGPPAGVARLAQTPEQELAVVATNDGAMVLYEDLAANDGIEVFAVPLRCMP